MTDTMRKTLFPKLALLVTVAAFATAAAAQTQRAVSNEPIGVGADNGGITGAGSFSLTGRAEVTQGGNRLRADSIVGAGNSDGVLSSVTASGNVYYVTPTESIRGDRAVYTISNATIVVTGDVILTQGKNVLTGGRLTYNIDTGAANMAGGTNSRIQGVFYPQGN